jgi:hypothetical protein
MSRTEIFFSCLRFLKSRLLSQDFDSSRFLSRLLRHIENVKICWEAARFVKKFGHYWDLLSLKMMKSLNQLRNLYEKMQKSTHFSIEIETNCWEMPKFSDLEEFIDRDFLVWTLMLRQNWEVSISTKISPLLRRTLWRCWDFLNCPDALFDNVEIDWDTIETPRLKKKPLIYLSKKGSNDQIQLFNLFFEKFLKISSFNFFDQNMLAVGFQRSWVRLGFHRS